MALFATSSLIYPPHGGHDHVVIRQFDDRLVMVLADGAGGMGGAAQAARFACERAIEMAAHAPADARVWAERLSIIDTELAGSVHGGQTTLVVAEAWREMVRGASVGDSRAWLLSLSDEPVELTEEQARKPLLGSGHAKPCGFGALGLEKRRLLMVSDGVYRHAELDTIFEMASLRLITVSPYLVLDAVAPRRGEVHDHMALALCELGCDRQSTEHEIQEGVSGQWRDPVQLACSYEKIDQDEAAAHWWKVAADAGDVGACFEIGLRYAHGRGVNQNWHNANSYYRLGLQRGCGYCANNLGYHYELGNRELEQSDTLTLDCYRRSAELGCRSGQFNLAKAYQFGKFGVAVDAQRAALLFEAAALNQLPAAMVAWGDCLEKGIGVPKDLAAAKRQFMQAMEAGDSEAAWRLGLLYELGLGVERDLRRAKLLYADAAKRGCAPAQRCLGNLYLRGRGVELNSGLGRYWIEQAAQAGDKWAREILDGMVKDESRDARAN